MLIHVESTTVFERCLLEALFRRDVLPNGNGSLCRFSDRGSHDQGWGRGDKENI